MPVLPLAVLLLLSVKAVGPWVGGGLELPVTVPGDYRRKSFGTVQRKRRKYSTSLLLLATSSSRVEGE